MCWEVKQECIYSSLRVEQNKVKESAFSQLKEFKIDPLIRGNWSNGNNMGLIKERIPIIPYKGICKNPQLYGQSNKAEMTN